MTTTHCAKATSAAMLVALGLALVAWAAATSALLAGDAALAKPDIEKCEVTRPKNKDKETITLKGLTGKVRSGRQSAFVPTLSGNSGAVSSAVTPRVFPA